jgi:hypothetical protein
MDEDRTQWQISIATRSKAWVCGCLHSEIAGSNSAGGGHGCLCVVSVMCY